MSASEEPGFAIRRSTIEAHYFVNGCFFSKDDQLISEVGRISHIPAVIVAGRYDLVCPIVTAYELVKAWGPSAKLVVSPVAGHASIDNGNWDEIIQGIRDCLALADIRITDL